MDGSQEDRCSSADDFQLDPANANRGTDRGRELVAASLEECGAGRSILADRDGVVIAGNKTLAAAKQLGLPVKIIETDGSELIVVRRSDLLLGEDEKARRLAYLDNRASELGLDWDTEQLLADLQGGVDLSGIFDKAELDELLAGLLQRDGLTDPDDVPEAPEEPVSRLGDLWLLGAHRLLCGDSTSAECVRRLMDGERASLMATDPPYLVDYDGGNHPQTWGRDGKAITSEEKTKHWDAYVDHDTLGRLLRELPARGASGEALVEVPVVYQWFGMMRIDVVLRPGGRTACCRTRSIIWHKSRPVLARCDFMWDYEPCHVRLGRRAAARARSSPAGQRHCRLGDRPARGVEDDLGSVHPTIKPVELVRRPIEWHTKPGELIYEPFSGSGTAIIAAETDRPALLRHRALARSSSTSL